MLLEKFCLIYYLYSSIFLFLILFLFFFFFFFFQAEDGIRDGTVTGVQTCALPILRFEAHAAAQASHADRIPGPLRLAFSSPFGGADHRRGPAHPESWAKPGDRKSTRLNSSHSSISYAVFCLKKKKKNNIYSQLRTQ